MDSEPVISVTRRPETVHPIRKGRPIDLFAAILAAFAGFAAIIMAGIFFWGFAENDTRLPGLFSALALSILLASFAIIPAFYIARLAYKGWKEGLCDKSAWKTLLLSLPWIVLSIIFIRHTPIPLLLSWLILVLASSLFLWAATSLCLNHSRNIDER